MEVGPRRCCGIDVHKKKLTVHVLPPQGHAKDKPLEREFRTFTRDLRGLREWLKECGVSEAVMEATGQYWRPVWNVLEEEIPGLMLVNPQHVKALAGRKTDRIDAKRLARYLERGELVGSFIPPTADSRITRSDPWPGPFGRGDQSRQESHLDVVRSRQHQGFQRGDRFVRSFGPEHVACFG